MSHWKTKLSDLREVRPAHVARRLKGFFTEGWYFPGDESSRDRVRLLMYNYNANIIANWIGGTFLTGLLLLMQADDGFIGMTTMISTAANMLQMFAPLLLERFPRRKTLLLTLYTIMMAMNILLVGLIPLFPIGQQAQLALVAVTILIVNVINALVSPGLSIWHVQSLRPNVRNAFFSLVTMTVGAVVAIVNLIGSGLVDIFRMHDMEYEGLLLLRVLCAIIMVINVATIAKMREYPYHTSAKKFTFSDAFLKPLREKLYLRTVLVAFLWNFTANIPGSYYTVYLLDNLGLSYTLIMLVNFINVPVVLLATPLWNKLLWRKSRFTILYLSMSVYLMHYVLLSLVTNSAIWLYVVAMIVNFLLAAGINLSFMGIPYVNMPAESQTSHLGFYSTMANVAAFLGVTLGRQFILATEGYTLNLLGFSMVNKQYILLLTAALMLLAVLGIWRIQKKTVETDSDI